jgi:flagellum-specific ATP synthase
VPDMPAPPLQPNPQLAAWRATLDRRRAAALAVQPIEVSGRLTRAVGLVLEAVGLQLPVGSDCLIELPRGHARTHAEAEVVGFAGDRLFLMPQTEVSGLLPGARVFEGPPLHARGEGEPATKQLPVGDQMLGRVVDATGRPLDGLGPLAFTRKVPLAATPINPLTRAPIDSVLDVGVRAINAMLTVGRGQRMGLFAGSGVGKSVLLGMMARYTSADVIVVGLIGERGREVKEFIEHTLGAEGLARSVVVAAPADTSPLLRLQGAVYATCLAEYFRDEGKDVLLIMDSLTRYAMAQREIALAVGEPPATKGYPPSVFAKLPALVERAGNGDHGKGSITAFYTVLSEGDDQQDPRARHSRRTRGALARARRGRPLSGHRHRGLDQPRHDQPHRRAAVPVGAPLQAGPLALPAQQGPHRRRRVPARRRSADRSGHRAVPARRSLPAAADGRAHGLRRVHPADERDLRRALTAATEPTIDRPPARPNARSDS